jgi:ATP-dependent exoDNAse (exonuclease V) beta subunit
MKKKFKIYRSSAGSGKTFTLTKEYIKLTLVNPTLGNSGFDPNYFSQILAVTFTNDAAKEMKTRILEELVTFAGLSETDSSPMLDSIAQEVKEEYGFEVQKKELIRRAGKVHSTILHKYSNFSISTIDSFNKRVVQAFSRDLNVQHNFEVALDTEELIEEATSHLLEQVGTHGNPFVSNTLEEFTFKQTDKGNTWHIENKIKEFSKHLFQEDKWKLVEQIADLKDADFKQIKIKLFSYLADIEQLINSKAQLAIDLIKENGLNEKSFYYSKTGIYGYFLNASKLKKRIDFDKFVYQKGGNSRVQTTMNDDKWQPSKPTAADTEVIEGLKERLTNFYQEIEDIKNRETEHYFVATSMVKHIYQLATLGRMQNLIKNIKEDKNLVHISEFNRKINQIVEFEPIPYIYERLGERYKHILIDEFQDTSKMQWHNLIPLVSNALSFNMLNMIVGDAKQSIYRWRGGEPQQIVTLPKVPSINKNSPLIDQIGIFETQANSLNLQTNWRSKANVIHFNNDLFVKVRDSFTSQFPNLEGFYAEVEQKSQSKKGGKVAFNFLSGDKKSYQDATFEKVFTLVNKLSEENYKKSDIVILVRSNADGAFLAENFMLHGVAVISSESLLLASSPTIRFFISMFQILQNPQQAKLKFDILEFLFEHFEQKIQTQYDGIQLDASQQYFDNANLANQEDLQSFFEFIEDIFDIPLDSEHLQNLSLYQMTEELIDVFQINRRMSEQMYIQTFLDILLNFGKLHTNNLLDFLEFWELKKSKLSISSPQSDNAIRIMTIHKSKGLEFPVVILAFADWSLSFNKQSQIWLNWSENSLVPQLKTLILPLNKNILETSFAPQYVAEQEAAFIDGLNMLYVALTRAANELYVFGKAPTDRKLALAMPKDIQDISTNNTLLLYYLTKLHEKASQFEEDILKQFEETNEIELIVSDDLEEKNKEEKSKKEDFITFQLEEFISAKPQNKIQIRKESTSPEENELSLKDFYTDKKITKITRFALEKVMEAEDIPKVIENLTIRGIVNQEEGEMVAQKIINILNLNEIKDFFDTKTATIYTEKEILLKGSKWAIRANRLILQANKTILINYLAQNQDVEIAQNQIKSCVKALEDMNFSTVEPYLLDIDKENLVLIS